MKMLLPLCLLLLFIVGCSDIRTRDDSFQSLHKLVEQKFAGTCDCSPVTNDNLVISNEIFMAPLFEVVPRHSPFRIIVVECPFYSQAEYERQFTNDADQFTKAITATNLDADEALRLYPGATNFMLLPGWSYKSTGVDVEMRPNTVTPSNDEDQAYHVYSAILGMLKVYRLTNEPAGTAP
jgi:hypothetical protein